MKFRLLVLGLLISPTLYASTHDVMSLKGIVKQRLAELGQASGQNLSTIDEEKNRLHKELLNAVKKGRLDLAVALIKQKADVNYVDANGATPLSEALNNKLMLPLIIELLVAGASVDSLKNREHVEFCISVPFGGGDTPLHVAARLPKKDATLQQLIKAHPELVNSKNHRGATPLHCAVSEVNTNGVMQLLQAKALVDAVDFEGCTPLQYVFTRVPYPSSNIIRALVNARANVNSSDIHERTVLYCAATKCDGFGIASLLDAGATLDEKTAKILVKRDMFTPSFLALCQNPQHFLQSHKPEELNQLLLDAAYVGCANFVRLLVNHGVDITSVDKENRSALDLAIMGGNPETVNVVLKLMFPHVNSPERDAWYFNPKNSSLKPAFMTLKLLAANAVAKKIAPKIDPSTQPVAPVELIVGNEAAVVEEDPRVCNQQ